MPEYENMLGLEPTAKQTKKTTGRGCDHCPGRKLWKFGINPVMGRVSGDKQIMIVAQNPGRQENREGRELVGDSGEFLWSALKAVGIRRRDCEIQNAVRCWLIDPVIAEEKDELVGRSMKASDPEVKCCSLYTERALAKSRAKLYLIIGQVAAKQVLGKEWTNSSPRIYWSKKLDARVAVLDHPAYFLRGGTKERKEQFYKTLAIVAEELRNPAPKGREQYQHLYEQKYIRVSTKQHALQVYRKLKRFADAGRRISCDAEWANNKMLCYGFCPKPGLSYVFILDHKDNLKNPDLEAVRETVCKMLVDPDFKKIFVHGSSDVKETYAMMGVHIKGYDYDAEYAAYFYAPNMKKYGVDTMADVWVPEFTGYKAIVMPEAAPHGMEYMTARKRGILDYSKVPIDKLVVYNGADCDIPKRVELKTRKTVPLPLMRIYMDAGFTVDRMERNGPWIDPKQIETMKKIFPIRWHVYREKLRQMVGNSEFNPNSNPQLKAFLFKKLKFDCPVEVDKGKEVKRWSADKESLSWMKDKYHHPFVDTLLLFKAAHNIKSKSLESYENSANKHDGRLQTTWWLTGAITGRMRSGGGSYGAGKEKGIVNLQNVDNDPIVQNMLISDMGWYDLFDEWERQIQYEWDWSKMFEIDPIKKGYTDRAVVMQTKFIDTENFNLADDFGDLEIYGAFDHSQLEVRVLAQMSGEPRLVQAFENKLDIHCVVGSDLTGWPFERIKQDKDTRVACKQLHFAIIFQRKAAALFQQLTELGIKTLKGQKLTLKLVQELLDAYWRKYPRCRDLIEGFKAHAEEFGYVENLFGFRRPVGGDESRSTFEENQAANAPIQGTAGQMLVITMALLQRKRRLYQLLRNLRMEVHDSAVWSFKVKRLYEAFTMANKLMCDDTLDVIRNEFGVKWRVPLLSEGAAGFRMGVQVDIDEKEQDLNRFLTKWCLKCKEKNLAVQRELKSVERFGNVTI